MWFLLVWWLVEGEAFVQGSLPAALSKAESAQKLVLVDVYTTWCGPCKMLDRTTWVDEKVVQFLSEKVVAIKIDAEKGEGPAIARKYAVRGYPTLLLLNAKGEVVDKAMGYLGPAQFLSWARNAVP
jgi:thiol:disulfide interchange protein